MAPRHRASLSRSTLNPVLTAALASGLVLSLASCAPTEPPPEERRGSSTPVTSPPSAQGPAPFDVQSVIRRVSQAFRSESGAFTGGQQTFAVRVDLEGTVHFSPRKAHSDPRQSVQGEPLKLRTVSLTRGDRPLSRELRASVREDGTLALARGPVVEVLQNSDEGLEQRWELASMPEGQGDLQVRVELEGLEYAGESEAGHHYLDPQTGLGVRYGKATWVDAKGVRTAVESVRDGGALVMRVPAHVLEGSAYPAVLDPLISPESGIDTPVYRPTTGAQQTPTIAFGNGVYMVAWIDLRTGSEHIYGTRVRASDGVVLDPKGISITTFSGAKYRTGIAFDGTNFLVVWDDGRNGNMDIYAARVRASDGTVLDPTGIAVYRGASDQGYPAVAFDGTQYLVVWQDRRFSSSAGSDIFGARVRASDGVVLDTSSLRLTPRANEQTWPSVSFGGGNFLVVWQDDRNSSVGDLYATRVRPSDGAVLDTADGFALSTALGAQREPAIVFDGTNYFVVWSDYRNGSGDIYGARVRASDRSVLDPSGIALSTATDSQSRPQVTLVGSNYFVVWQDYRFGTNSDVYGTRVRVSDRAVLDPAGLPLSVGPKSESSPAVASDGTSPFVAWTDNRSTAMSDIYGTRVGMTDGAPLDGTGVVLGTQVANQWQAAIAAGGDGYLVVWSESQGIGGSDDVYGARVRGSDGALLDPAGILISARSTREQAPAVAFDGTNFLVVWEDDRGSSTWNLYGARIRTSDGVVLDPDGIAITTGANNQVQASVASNGSSFLVVWKDSRNSSGGEIYGALVRASDGTRLATDVPISSDANWYNDFPKVASDGVDYLVTWHYQGSGSAIRGARVSGSTGARLSPEFSISTIVPSAYGAAVSYGGGVYLVAWTGSPTSGEYNVYAARVRAVDGAVLDNPSLPAWTLPGYQYLSDVAFDGGNFLVAWQNSTQNVSGTRVSPTGALVDGQGFVITTGNHGALLASSAPGHFMGVFSVTDPVMGVLRARKVFVTFGSNGAACAATSDCESAYCVDGVCCSSACETGTCGGGTCVEVSTDITCPGDVVAEATSASGALVSYPPATATGKPPLSVTYSQDSGSLFSLGSTGVTATLVDGLGRTDSCAFAVTVQDSTAPLLSCPADVTVEATSTAGADVSYALATASDSVSSVVVAYSAASGSHFNVASTPVTVTATDGFGNSASCAFTVTVVLPAAPQITCPGDVVAEATSASGALVSYPPATATGKQPLSVTYSQNSGTQFALGAASVTATVTDALGRTDSCSFSVTVRDTTAPVLSCPDALVAEASGPNGAAVSFSQPTATDAVSSAPLVSVSHSSGSTFPLGATQVTVTATDEAGNTASCAFSVTVRDTTAPSLSCPADVTAEATSTTGADVSYAPAAASDSVSSVVVAYSAASGSHFDVGSTPVTATATDGSGNSASCVFTVTVVLPAAPQITCPGDVVAEATSASGALVSYSPATATGREPLSVTYSQNAGTQFALGTTSVTATVTDELGRTDSCSFSVIVRDTTAPSLQCGANLVAEATGPAGAEVSFSQPTATDSVSAAPLVSVSHSSGSTFPLGATQVIATATDEAGNSASCSFTVTVRDTTAPSLSCPADVTAEATSATGADVSYAPATASDSISSATLRYSHASETRFGLGTTTVTVTATDEAGNTVSCSFSVTVRDATPPALTCVSDLTAEATGPTGATVDFTLPTALDAVTESPLLTISHEPGSLFPQGATLVTAMARDSSGNSASCSFTVTVHDTTPPEVGCPGALIAEAEDATGASVAYSVPAPRDTVTASPAVSTSHAPGSRFPLGTTQVHLSASDEAGNTASCTFTVTVRDTTAPTLTCPADVTVANAPPEGTAVDYPSATGSDAVSTPTMGYSPSSGTIFPVGTTPVTATATDASGNSATCSFQVRVQQSVSVPTPAAGCGCGAGSDTSTGLGWGALLMLAWGVTRRSPSSRRRARD